MAIVVVPPRFELLPGIVERRELVDVQALIAQASVKRFYVAVFSRLSWPNEMELHTASPSPVFQRSRREFGTALVPDFGDYIDQRPSAPDTLPVEWRVVDKNPCSIARGCELP